MTKEISKSAVTKQSVNWYRKCTFLNHTGVEDKILYVLPQSYKTLLMSYFEVLAQQSQFGKANKPKIPHGTVKSSTSDVSVSFGKAIWHGPKLYISVLKYLILQQNYGDIIMWTLPPSTRRP